MAIDQDTVNAAEKELIEFLESFEGIEITADVARDFFEESEDINKDLHTNINETLTEMIDLDLVIEAQMNKNRGVREQLLGFELNTPMISIVKEAVKDGLYELRIYDDE